jgi:hypothetical protein
LIRPTITNRAHPVAACIFLLLLARSTAAQDAPTAATPVKSQAEREAALSKLLTGATLEGSYTTTDGGRAPDQLSRDRYTLGEVKKLEGNLWLIQARIEYKGSQVMLPLPLPIEWAGDTPMIVVDNVTIPGFGTFSARVMFYDKHYAGYWKHTGEADHGGHLFGIIRPAAAATNTP